MKRQSASVPNVRSSSSVEENALGRVKSNSSSALKNEETSRLEPCSKPIPFHIRWIDGLNYNVKVINLNHFGSTVVFYAAANCGVLYNWTTKTMKILQGHKNTVNCIGSTWDGKWLVTAGTGAQNVLIIWDSVDLYPQKTLFSPHGEYRMSKVAISSDGKYLLTTAKKEKSIELRWWIWSQVDEANAKYEVDMVPHESITGVMFNPFYTAMFLLLTSHNLWVGMAKRLIVIERGVAKESDNYELVIRLLGKDLHHEYGNLTSFTFLEKSSQILVATSRGTVLIFGYQISFNDNIPPTGIDRLRFIKALKVEKKAIKVIKFVDGYVVTGNKCGDVHFYDEQMKLVYWIEGLVSDIISMTFNKSPRSSQIFDFGCKKKCLCWEKVYAEKDPETGIVKQKLLLSQISEDATVSGKPFLVRDFVISTKKQGIVFVDFVTEKVTTIVDTINSDVLTMSVHPEKPLICKGYVNGMVELNNFVLHKKFARLNLRDYYKIVVPPDEESIHSAVNITIPHLSVTCLKYSPSGMHLACGLNTGQLLFLDPVTIKNLTPTPFHDVHASIKHMDYSPDSITFAMGDSNKTVCVYKFDCATFKWNFVAKHRSHYKDIVTVLFVPKKNPDGENKLLSLGHDRHIVEYDIGASKNEHLEIARLDRCHETAHPLNAIVWPPPKNLDPAIHRTDLPTLLIATDEHKYQVLNYKTSMVLAVVLGPRYDHPVRLLQLVTVKVNGEELQYMMFAARTIIGMQKLPLDGNPWKHIGQIGHPHEVLQMSFREDLCTQFTIGAKSTVAIQWSANFRAVEYTTKKGGIDLDPYYCLVENGRPGWLFQQMRDLFYYIQILCQGTFTPAMRRVKDVIPIASLPDLYRTLGSYPSQFAVEVYMTEAKYRIYLKEPLTDINFDDSVMLFLNHRPAFGIDYRELQNAFLKNEYFDHTIDGMTREDFIHCLTKKGEHFSLELSWYLLSILCGHSFEERAMMEEGDFSFLPDVITFNVLVNDIIGIHAASEPDTQSFGTDSVNITESSDSD